MNKDGIINELEKILEKLETALENCSNKILFIKEAQEIISETKEKIEKLLPKDTIAYRVYDRLKHESNFWWEESDTEYVMQSHSKIIEYWILIVQKVMNEFEPEFLRYEKRSKTQFFIHAGEFYRAKKIIYKIMKKAQNKLSIVDSYLDDTVFDYIESIDNLIEIRLITSNKKPIFKQLYNSLKTTRSNIEARESHLCHDRFLIIDAVEIWHLGTSINNAGKKAFMINKVNDSDEINKLTTNFQSWWSQGIPI